MRRRWTPEELDPHWSLSSQERKLLRNRARVLRLRFTAKLKSFERDSRLPEDAGRIPLDLVRHLALQVGISARARRDYSWKSRTISHSEPLKATLMTAFCGTDPTTYVYYTYIER